MWRFGSSLFKRQCYEIFDPHFSSLEPAKATEQWVKIFSILGYFLGYHTPKSQSPRSIILSRVNLTAVSYCAESSGFSGSYLKGQSTDIFDLFFYNTSLPGPLSNGLKYFRFRLVFRRVIQIFCKNFPAEYHNTVLLGFAHDPRYFLKLLHRPLKEQCQKNKCGFLFY